MEGQKPKLDIFYAVIFDVSILWLFYGLFAYYALELFETKSVSFWFRVDYGVRNVLQTTS